MACRSLALLDISENEFVRTCRRQQLGLPLLHIPNDDHVIIACRSQQATIETE